MRGELRWEIESDRYPVSVCPYPVTRSLFILCLQPRVPRRSSDHVPLSPLGPPNSTKMGSEGWVRGDRTVWGVRCTWRTSDLNREVPRIEKTHWEYLYGRTSCRSKRPNHHFVVFLLELGLQVGTEERLRSSGDSRPDWVTNPLS